MTGRLGKASPRTRARLTGVVYLLFFATAVLGAVVAPGISGPGATGDAAATANNIMAHQTAFRVGWALELTSTAFYVALMALFYQLFKPVSRTLALLAAFFGLVGCAVTAYGSLFQLAPMLILGGSPYLSAFNPKQIQALALLFLNLNVRVGYIALVFFGVFQIVLGYLIFKSTFLPRVIGVLIALAGLGWLTFLSPPLANELLTPLEVLGFVAEAALMLWLLIKGVNSQRWTEQAA
ncbi:MAG TPA: DUF4386 domain-containing protein [Candidatus Binatus sp.]|nr:DUF4386 domain-containing protein [Candidatus Binatus sp.]